MIWDSLKGHQHQMEMFRRAIGRNRLAHAYLLIGPSGIGKRYFAKLLAQCLFCPQFSDEELEACGECHACRQMQAGTHPDLLEIGLPDGKRSIPLELLIGDRENRGREGLCHDIAMKPMSANRRIAIINDAEMLYDESANSILKTLEEPPPGAILFLLTPDIEPILPTIRSRCQPVRFQSLADEDLRELLLQENSEAGELPHELIRLADGSLDTARQLLDPGLDKLRRKVSALLTQPTLNSGQAIKDVSEILDELGGDPATQRKHLRWVLQFAIDTLGRKLKTAENVDECDRIGLMLDRCFETELHIRQTMPVPLCLEALFASLGRRSRGMLS